MEITKTIKDRDYELHNHIKIEAGNYVHTQIETINGRTFMRSKQRKLIEVM